jgi:putative ABC transport system ATP-binding protein
MSLLEVENLSRTYHLHDENELTVLHSVSFSVERGESVAIMGRSGSGKSTLLNILGCLDKPTSGLYRLDGREIPWHSEPELARIRNKKIGFVFQEFALIPGYKAWENVALPAIHAGMTFRSARKQAGEVLGMIGMEKWADRGVEELSGGQRQRVAIARAIMNGPDLILADEPTGALDATTSDQVLQALLGLREHSCTVVMVTHDPHVAKACDRIYQMNDGTLRETSPSVL